MEIPYTVQPREDTGLFNAKVGIWLFLASEVMLFGALFSAYILLRVGSTNWLYGEAKDLNVWLGTANTGVLIKFKAYMGATILLGLVFMVIKAFEYTAKFHHGHLPGTHTFYAIYFTLTGLHAVHVFGGMVVNSFFWGPGSKLWKSDPVRFTNRVEIGGLFWHFVDLVWIFLFPVLYLL